MKTGIASIKTPLISIKLLSGGALISAGVAIVAIFTFLRSLILAREISVEDYGVATALLTSLSLIQMGTAIAADKQILQDKEGAEDHFLAAVHSLAIIRGLIAGVLMFLAAYPISVFFALPDALWAFQLVALSPVIAGFFHYDYAAQQRNSDHRAAVLTTSLPEVAVTLLLIPCLTILPDYRAILVVCLGWPLSRLIVSHLVAHRSYDIWFDSELILKLFGFSWPLMLSGFLLFLIFHGDRSIVGHYFDMETLGYFSLVLTAFLLPGQLLHRVYDSLLLSPLSRSFQRGDDFDRNQSAITYSLFVFSSAYACFSITAGPWLFLFLFGEKYEPALNILPWVIVMVSVRILRIAPSLAGLSSSNPAWDLYANLGRAIAVPIAISALTLGHSIESVIIAGILGEVFALMIGTSLVRTLPFKSHDSIADYAVAMTWILLMLSVMNGGIGIFEANATLLFNGALLIMTCIFFLQKFTHLKRARGISSNV